MRNSQEIIELVKLLNWSAEEFYECLLDQFGVEHLCELNKTQKEIIFQRLKTLYQNKLQRILPSRFLTTRRR